MSELEPDRYPAVTIEPAKLIDKEREELWDLRETCDTQARDLIGLHRALEDSRARLAVLEEHKAALERGIEIQATQLRQAFWAKHAAQAQAKLEPRPDRLRYRWGLLL